MLFLEVLIKQELLEELYKRRALIYYWFHQSTRNTLGEFSSEGTALPLKPKPIVADPSPLCRASLERPLSHRQQIISHPYPVY